MEKTPVHGSVAQLAQGATVGKRKDSLTAEIRGNAFQPCRNFVESLVPANALEIGPCGADTLVRGLEGDTLRRYSSHRVEDPIRRINSVKILRDFGAQKSARNRVRRIALDLYRPAAVHGNQHSACVRTIVRARGMDNLLHDS